MRKIYWLLMPILIFSSFFGSIGVVSADDEVPPEEETTMQNPVIAFLASITGESVEQIVSYQKEGYGLGNIAKAYYLMYFVSLEEGFVLPGDGTLVGIMEQGKLSGWGNLYKELGLNPGLKKGLGWLFKQDLTVSEDNEILKPVKPGNDKSGPPDHANNDKDKTKDKKDKK